VKDNKAVVDYTENWAGAVPQSYQDDWTSLWGWEDTQSDDDYRFHYKIAGDTVSELKWRYTWSKEGKAGADGTGHYVMNAGATIKKLYAKTGQTLTATVAAKAPLNYGTFDDPIAGIDITVEFTSASAFNSATTTCTVTVKGDGSMDEKSCEGNDP
jgi:hypothetical protein